MKKLIGLDRQEIKIDIKPSSHPMRNEHASKSRIQYRCGQILREKFPLSSILEEVHVPKHGFILDFYLPKEAIVVEVNGKQHNEYTPFFHKTKSAFHASQTRDSNKAEWCSINNITLLVVESSEELEELL